MGQKLRGKILETTDPGWRERPLMAEVLASQERIRNDPAEQALRKQVDDDSRRTIIRITATLLLSPIVLWSAFAVFTGADWTLALNETPVQLYVLWAFAIAALRVTLAP